MSSRAAAYLAWSLWIVCVVLVGLALLFDFVTTEYLRFFPGERLSPGLAVLTGVLALAYPTVGALIVSRLPDNPVGWIFCGMGLLYGLLRFAETYADFALLENLAFPGGEYAAWFPTALGEPLAGLMTVFLLLLFPNGRLPSRRWRIVAWAAIIGEALILLGDAFMPGTLRTHFYVQNPFGIGEVIGGGFTTYDLLPASSLLGLALTSACTLAALASLIFRLRRARGDERQQLKWFLYAAVPLVVSVNLILLQIVAVKLADNILFVPAYEVNWDVFGYVLVANRFAVVVPPIVTYVAILRYRLYDIDLVINRTLVYGALTACVAGIYVIAVGGLGALFQARGNLVVSLLATGLVAVLFQPLRSKLQRAVNRLMYGERDDPYVVLSRLGARLEATLAPHAVLPAIVETIAEALKLPYAAIALKHDGTELAEVAEYGKKDAAMDLLALPLTYHKEPVGELLLATRAPGEAFDKSDLRLLQDLSRQIGVAAHDVRLTADLQRSREQLVTAHEEERRRLRRELHDGVGPQLAALMLELETAHDLLSDDPEASALMTKLSERARGAVSDVRRSVHDLRPPALDELGLIGTLRETATQYTRGDLKVSVEAPETLPPLPAAVEVACYRIAREAMTNVTRHAQAYDCRVRVALDEEVGVLRVEVEDDGRGFGEADRAGVGMSSMRERAEELGGRCSAGASASGGVLVSAVLPCRIAQHKGW